MRRIIVLFLLLFAFVVLSCIPIAEDKQAYRLDFSNNSDIALFVIVDLVPDDGIISSGSYYQKVLPHQSGIYANHPWQTIVKDSMSLYILDATEIVFFKEVGMHTVEEAQIDLISKEMVLSVLTVHHKDLVPGTNRSFSYP